MNSKSIANIKFRRRRESVTDYNKRLKLAKSGIDRVVVRRTNSRIIGQVAKYTQKGDMILAHVDSEELKKFNWPARPNKATAYLAGMLLAKKFKDGAKNDHILDIGLASPVKDTIPFVFAKGCIDGGMKVRGTFKIEEKAYNLSNTKHISALKSEDAERYKKQYSAYIKGGVEPESLGKLFNEAKEKIMKA